jgi:DNA helicase HerA-like ATPase
MPDTLAAPEAIAATLTDAYGFDAPGVSFGAAMRGDEALAAVQVRVPLAMMNRHGLVAGATGTGKTKTLQVLAEQLSDAGVPVFISDIKGDISGLAAAAERNDKLTERASAVGFADYAPRAFPVEFLTLDQQGKGVRLRASVSSFGPILLAKVLDLNETQQSVLALVFKYADDKQLPLVNLEDLRALVNHLSSAAGKAEMAEYGGIATATAGVIIRKIVELEQQEADAFFGAPEFEVEDFLRLADDGRGVISILELADMQDRPALFSTFMMWLLASLYESLPEIGDPEKPKLVFFFDEAHLLFRDANETFRRQIELVARLIRSKGVGVFFVSHSPSDVPAEVLGQLGNRVQHALRAFTPDDLEVVKATAETFPTTDLYDVENELTALGTGEALITALDLKGRPLPTARTMMRPPMSLMAQVAPSVVDTVVAASTIVATYATDSDPESAKELLAARMARATEAAQEPIQDVKDPESPAERKMRPTRAPERGVDWGDVAQEGARLARSGTFNTILRSILGVLTKRR